MYSTDFCNRSFHSIYFKNQVGKPLLYSVSTNWFIVTHTHSSEGKEMLEKNIGKGFFYMFCGMCLDKSTDHPHVSFKIIYFTGSFLECPADRSSFGVGQLPLHYLLYYDCTTSGNVVLPSIAFFPLPLKQLYSQYNHTKTTAHICIKCALFLLFFLCSSGVDAFKAT